MSKQQGFYSFEPLNKQLTMYGLVFNHTVQEGYGNRNVSKEIIETFVLKVPPSRQEVEELAKQVRKKIGLTEIPIWFVFDESWNELYV